MKIWVVMGNDFPDSVWSSEEKAEKAIEQNRKADRAANPDKFKLGYSGIWYKAHKFTLDNGESTTGDIHEGCGGIWTAADQYGLIDRCSRCNEERA